MWIRLKYFISKKQHGSRIERTLNGNARINLVGKFGPLSQLVGKSHEAYLNSKSCRRGIIRILSSINCSIRRMYNYNHLDPQNKPQCFSHQNNAQGFSGLSMTL